RSVLTHMQARFLFVAGLDSLAPSLVVYSLNLSTGALLLNHTLFSLASLSATWQCEVLDGYGCSVPLSLTRVRPFILSFVIKTATDQFPFSTFGIPAPFARQEQAECCSLLTRSLCGHSTRVACRLLARLPALWPILRS